MNFSCKSKTNCTSPFPLNILEAVFHSINILLTRFSQEQRPDGIKGAAHGTCIKKCIQAVDSVMYSLDFLLGIDSFPQLLVVLLSDSLLLSVFFRK